jgi:hypothetical protein
MVDCMHVNRENGACILEEIEVGGKNMACLSFEPDYEYLRRELKRRIEKK